MKKFKPMLADDANLEKLRFPVYGSPKLDGIRATVTAEGPRTRSLKAIPNQHINSHDWGHLWGLDGEFIVGDPCDPKVYSKTESGVMTRAGEPDFAFYVFDYAPVLVGDNDSTPFRIRNATVANSKQMLEKRYPFIRIVEQVLLENVEQLQAYENQQLELGYEGIMLRDPEGPYKLGRSTVNQQYLLKLKRFKDDEAEIIGFQEKMHNANEATTNALGYTERSSHKANKVPLDTLGALVVRDITSGVEFNIGTGFDDATRAEIWGSRDTLVGRIVKYKHFPIGVKDKPRFPVFQGFRSRDDMGE